jgi:hypothetical protein
MNTEQQLKDPEIFLDKVGCLSMISQQIVDQNFVQFTPKKKVVKSWEFFEVDLPLGRKTVANEIVTFQLKTLPKHYGVAPFGIIKEAPSLKFETRTGRIPSDLVPEVIAVSATTTISLVGVLAAIAFAVAPTLFLAPLMAGLVAAIFLWKTIRTR